MGWIFGEGTSGMFFAGGALLLVMYLYLWLARPMVAIELTEGFAKVVFAIFTIAFKILYAIFKWLANVIGALFTRRRR